MLKSYRLLALSILATPACAAFLIPSARAAQAQAPSRSFTAAGPSSEADLKRLREALSKVEGVEQIEVARRAGGASVKIRGDFRPQRLMGAALAVGFDLMPPSTRTYRAMGPSADADIQRLRDALTKAAETAQIQIDARSGSVSVRVRGEVKGGALAAAAMSVGFELRRESSYVASGSTSDTDYKRLREALGKVPGVEKVDLSGVAGGASLLIVGDPEDEEITTAAKSSGYALRPLGAGASDERITPPAPGERIVDDITRVGEPAPDFSLVAKDGKGTVRLSDYRGKKPVVLIFGSYT